jgi:hypothetical protein
LDRLPSIIAEALEALRAGAGIHPLGSPPERLTFTAEERDLLDRLTRDTPDIVQSMAGDVADALRQTTPAVPAAPAGGQRPRMADYVSFTRPTNAPTAAGGG